MTEELLDERLEDEEDEFSDLCPSCSGTGISRWSNRPDDYGPHHNCDTCRGTGIAPEYDD